MNIKVLEFVYDDDDYLYELPGSYAAQWRGPLRALVEAADAAFSVYWEAPCGDAWRRYTRARELVTAALRSVPQARLEAEGLSRTYRPNHPMGW